MLLTPLERSHIYANSVLMGVDFVSTLPFAYEKPETYRGQYPFIREDPLPFIQNENESESEKSKNEPVKKVVYGRPPKEADFGSIRHDEIQVNNVLNLPLWDNAKWKGVAVAQYQHGGVPYLALIFSNETGSTIFQEWISKYGASGILSKIGVGIIKGIDCSNPYWYRISIGSKDAMNLSVNSGAKNVFAHGTRFTTINAKTDQNLQVLEEGLKKHQSFYLCPAFFNEFGLQCDKPHAILMKQENIIIVNAWEVEDHNLILTSAVLPDDDPIIPSGFEDAPILRAINGKSFNSEVE